MDTRLGESRPRFILSRGVIPEGRVPSLPIVEHLNVFEDILRGFVTGRVMPMIDQFTLECSEETLDSGVVPVVASATHAGDEAVLIQADIGSSSRHTDAAIRMVYEPCCGGPVRHGHRKGLLNQLNR